jgi:lipopolysaccharide transport system permease protein
MTDAAASAPSAPRAEIVIAPPKGAGAIDFGELWAHRELFWQFAYRDLQVRYKQAALGVLWAVLTPVVTAAIFTVIFGLLGRLPTDGVPRSAFYLAGLTGWLFFSGIMQGAAQSMVAQRGLFTKVYFPRMLLPLAATAVPLTDYVMAFLVLVGLTLYHGLVPNAHALYAVPLCVLWAWAAATGVGLWFAALNVYFRDIGHIVPFLTRIGMFASPVLYPISMIPAKWHWLYALNPMAGVIEWTRWVLFHTQAPPAPVVLVSLPVTLVLLVTGAWFFRRMEHTFVDVV